LYASNLYHFCSQFNTKNLLYEDYDILAYTRYENLYLDLRAIFVSERESRLQDKKNIK